MPVNKSEQAFFDMLAAEMAKNPPDPTVVPTLAELRESMAFLNNFTGEAAEVEYSDISVKNKDSSTTTVRIYNPGVYGPVLIFFPGNAYILDFFNANAIACSRIAQHAKAQIMLVNLRIVPEASILTVIDDAYGVIKHVSKNAKSLNIDSNKISIGGYSSGAHCAASISNLNKREKSVLIQHQILFNGAYDFDDSFHEYESFASQDKMYDPSMFLLFRSFMIEGIDEAECRKPILAPAFEPDLSNQPKTTIIVGEYDGDRSASEDYYLRLKKSGNDVKKIVLPGQTHTPFILRAVMTDGEDPAKVIADVFKSSF